MKRLLMKNILLLLLNISLLPFIGCDNSVDDSNVLIQKTWIHSYEESGDSTQIFRPEGFRKFPLNRFRGVNELKSEGVCKYLVLAPNDAHYFMSGTWSYSDKTKELKIYKESGQLYLNFVVLTLSKDKLEVKAIV